MRAIWLNNFRSYDKATNGIPEPHHQDWIRTVVHVDRLKRVLDLSLDVLFLNMEAADYSQKGLSKPDENSAAATEFTTNPTAFKASISAFLSALNTGSQPIRVHATLGNRDAYGDANTTVVDTHQFMDRVNLILSYNKVVAKKARFAGIHIDVEPYGQGNWTASGFGGQDDTDLTALANLIASVHTAIATHNKATGDALNLSVAIPEWYRAFTNIATAAALCSKGADFVVTMCYADGTEGWLGTADQFRTRTRKATSNFASRFVAGAGVLDIANPSNTATPLPAPAIGQAATVRTVVRDLEQLLDKETTNTAGVALWSFDLFPFPTLFILPADPSTARSPNLSGFPVGSPKSNITKSQSNTLTATVHNLGTVAVPNVSVRFSFAPCGLGNGGTFIDIGSTLDTVKADVKAGYATTEFTFTPWTIHTDDDYHGNKIGSYDHFCVKAQIEGTYSDNAYNEARTNFFDVEPLATPWSEAKGFDGVEWEVKGVVANPTGKASNDARIVATVLPRELVFSLVGQPSMRAGEPFAMSERIDEVYPVVFRLTTNRQVPEKWPASVELRLVIDGRVVDGISLRLMPPAARARRPWRARKRVFLFALLLAAAILGAAYAVWFHRSGDDNPRLAASEMRRQPPGPR